MREWVAEAFRRHGIRYEADHHPPLDKSAAYLEAEPLFTQGRLDLLDHAVQRRELVCLERRPRPGNKATVDHPTSAGAHDDYANALALAAAVASRQRRRMFEEWAPQAPEDGVDPTVPDEDDERMRRDGWVPVLDSSGRGQSGAMRPRPVPPCSCCGTLHGNDARCPHAAPTPADLRRWGWTYGA